MDPIAQLDTEPVQPQRLDHQPAQRLNKDFPSLLRHLNVRVTSSDAARRLVSLAEHELIRLEKSIAMTSGAQGSEYAQETVGQLTVGIIHTCAKMLRQEALSAMLRFTAIQATGNVEPQAIQRLLVYALRPLDGWTTAVLPDVMAVQAFRYMVSVSLMWLSEGIASLGMHRLSKEQRQEVYGCINMSRSDVRLGNEYGNTLMRGDSIVRIHKSQKSRTTVVVKPCWAPQMKKALRLGK